MGGVHTFSGFDNFVNDVCFSADGQQIAARSGTELHIYDLDFELEFPGWRDWHEDARPYLEFFYRNHPDWTDDDFNNILIPDLQNRGFGWLRPEGVKAKLEKIPAQTRR